MEIIRGLETGKEVIKEQSDEISKTRTNDAMGEWNHN